MTDDDTDIGLGDGSIGPETPALRIHVQHTVLDDIAAHTMSDTSVEQGGVLVGDIDETAGTLLVYGSVRAEGAEATNSSLTFTHEAWDHIGTVMERDWSGQRIVGWYHSHPSFGIFLSEFDRFICDNFFSEPWQVAYVHDPLSGDDGFFARSEGDIVRIPDWDVCTRMDAPRPERSVAEAVHRIEPVVPIHAASTSSVTPALAGIAGLLIGALLFGLLLRPSPERVTFAAPALTDSVPLFIDAGSVAIGRDGTVFAGEPGVVRLAQRGGTLPVATFDGPEVPPVAVTEDGSLIFADPAAGTLHRVADVVTTTIVVEDQVAWGEVTALAASGSTLWVLDGPAGQLYELTVPDDAEEPGGVTVEDPLPIGVTTAVGVAADGDRVWVLDGEGRLLERGGEFQVVAGGGDLPWNTPEVATTDVSLAGAVAVAAADDHVYVAIAGDTSSSETALPAAVITIRDDRLRPVAQPACVGPLAAVLTPDGPVVAWVEECSGLFGSALVGDDAAVVVPDDGGTVSSAPAPASSVP